MNTEEPAAVCLGCGAQVTQDRAIRSWGRFAGQWICSPACKLRIRDAAIAAATAPRDAGLRIVPEKEDAL